MVKGGRSATLDSFVRKSQPFVAALSTNQPKLFAPAAQYSSDFVTSNLPAVAGRSKSVSGSSSSASGGRLEDSPSDACMPPIDPKLFQVAVDSFQSCCMRYKLICIAEFEASLTYTLK